MRRLLALLIPLVAALGLACVSVDTQRTLGPCPTPSVDDIVTTPGLVSQEVRTGDFESTIWQGARILQDTFVDKIDRNKLIEAALKGAADAASKKGVTVPKTATLGFGKGSQDAELRTALQDLEDAAASKFTSQQLADIALTAMADSLEDGHTSYLNSETWQSYLNRRVRTLGFRGQPLGDGLVITAVLPGSMGADAGLRAGDVVVSYNGQKLVAGRSAGSTPSVDETVRVGYTRQGSELIEVDLKSTRVLLPPVEGKMAADGVGLLRMYTFPSKPGCDFLKSFDTALTTAVDDLKANGARSWVLDLRDNGGGAIATATLVAGRLGFDGVVADIVDRSGARDPQEARGNSLIGKDPVAILINANSASSSELVSFSFQDAGRGRLFGKTSAGEVEASRPYPIAGGGFLITIGRVYAGPSLKILQGSGVKPDQDVDLDLALLAREGRDSQVDAAVAYLRSKLP